MASSGHGGRREGAGRPVSRPCGTQAGWRRHRGRGEPPCRRCEQARERWVTGPPVPLLEVELAGLRPFTANQVRRQGWAQTARLVADWRTKAAWTARAVLAPAGSGKAVEAVSGPVIVVATPLHRNRRSVQDVGACGPAGKACVDGLVDAGLLPGDGPEWVTELRFRPPDVCGVDGLRLQVWAADGFARDPGP